MLFIMTNTADRNTIGRTTCCMKKLKPVTADIITGSSIPPDDMPPMDISSGTMTGSSSCIVSAMVSMPSLQ